MMVMNRHDDRVEAHGSGRWPVGFILKLVIFASGIWLFDMCAGAGLGWLYGQTEIGSAGVVNRAMRQRNELVVIGDSRVRHHFNPALLRRETGLSTYNAGVNGQSMLFFYAMEQLILSAYRPRMIMLHLGPGDFTREQEALDRLSVLLPHADHPEVRKLLMLRSPYERFKLLSRTYPYNSMLVALLGAALVPSHGAYEDGFVPLYGKTLAAAVRVSRKKGRGGSDEVGIPAGGLFLRTLEDFIDSAQARNVSVVICVSPEWGVVVLDDAVRRLIGDKGAAYIEISRNTHPVFKDPRLFKTRGYLNAEGATVFSKILGEELSKRVLIRAGPRGAASPDNREQAR